MKTLIEHIESFLKTKIDQPALYRQAFNHTSYINEQKDSNLQHNERLEFLGDAVLELLTSKFLYHKYPEKPEGTLSRMRAQLVQEASLAYLAKQLSFHQYILLGKGEMASGGNLRDSILSDCFEAFLGALYLDLGLKQAELFLNTFMFEKHLILIQQINADFKTLFQERVQQKGKVMIQYQVLDQTGPAHDQVFTVGLFVDETLLATATGKNKKSAEMLAAKNGMDQVDERGNIINVPKQN